jgi:hypothetical protein
VLALTHGKGNSIYGDGFAVLDDDLIYLDEAPEVASAPHVCPYLPKAERSIGFRWGSTGATMINFSR